MQKTISEQRVLLLMIPYDGIALPRLSVTVLPNKLSLQMIGTG